MIEDYWWEVRLQCAGGRSEDDLWSSRPTDGHRPTVQWAPWAGPYASEEEAHEFVDGLTLYGRQIAIVKCEVWVKAIL